MTLILECGIIWSVSKRGCWQEDSMNRDIGPELHTIWSEAKEHIEQGEYDKAIDIYKYVLIRYGDTILQLSTQMRILVTFTSR